MFIVFQHFPKATAEGVIRNMKKIKIRTRHNGDNTECTINSYQRIKDGPIEMYMTTGSYEFARANNLEKGDKLEFQLSDPPYVVVIDIVCKPTND
jgi:anaerobic selenocysteine-containing dehydrogenase